MPVTAYESFLSSPVEVGEAGHKTYTRLFDIYDDDNPGVWITPQQAASAANLPHWGDGYLNDHGEADSSATVTGISLSPDNDANSIWRARVTYSTRTPANRDGGGGGGGDPSGRTGVGPVGSGISSASPANPAGLGGGSGGGGPGGSGGESAPQVTLHPLLRPAEFSYGSRRQPKILKEDYSDPPKPVVNSAGSPFDPPVETTEYITVLTVLKNFPLSQITPEYIKNVRNKVNLTKWQGIDPFYARLDDVTAEPKQEYGIWYWATRWVIEIKDEQPWNPVRVLDAGWEERIIEGGMTTGFRMIKDDYLQPISRPALLDGEGQKAAIDATPHYLEFKGYKTIEFRSFRLFAGES